MKLAVLFGGSSNEHEVSIVSACSIIKNLDHQKYEIMPIYLDKNNQFWLWVKDISTIGPMEFGILPEQLKLIEAPFQFLKNMDSVFLMIHGKNGEDGTLASVFDFLGISYIGNKPMPSMITMDKIYAKDILELNHIRTAKYIAFTKYLDFYIMEGKKYTLDQVLDCLEIKMIFPLFIKPANSGSSVGISKAKNREELEQAIKIALDVDTRILAEQEIKGRELECAILECKGKILASTVGEILASDEFYSYDAKYKNQESKTLIPALLSSDIARQIKEIAIQAFQILNLRGYSRVDFFLDEEGNIILNEINTIPGFTEISMYPKLWEASGFSYTTLLDILVEESLKK